MKKAIKIEYCGAPWNEFFFFKFKEFVETAIELSI